VIPFNRICDDPDTNVGLLATFVYSTYEAVVAVPSKVPINDPLSVLIDPDVTATNARTITLDSDGGTSINERVELDTV